MVKKVVTICREEGLEARPIAMLVQKASQFASTVYVEVGAKSVNAKSIMGMMSLNVTSGDEIVIVTNGADEEAAAKEIEAYLTAQ
ncbi:MAG: HPr family phosphocarrier protein [Tyzzerella sp.]|nr:HPr family phosphocarrier protein [Tyzzerella sp.]